MAGPRRLHGLYRRVDVVMVLLGKFSAEIQREVAGVGDRR